MVKFSIWAMLIFSATQICFAQKVEAFINPVQQPNAEHSITYPKTLPRNESPCFVINKITLEGEEEEQFQWVLKSVNDEVLGHCLGTEGVNYVMAVMQNIIIKQGFITTRLLVPSQTLARGMLTLTLVPGRIDAIEFTGSLGADINYREAIPIKSGDVLNLRPIERTLEYFYSLPNLTANIHILPTKNVTKAGHSDLLIILKDRQEEKNNNLHKGIEFSSIHQYYDR